jgi:hypothetical protein
MICVWCDGEDCLPNGALDASKPFLFWNKTGTSIAAVIGDDVFFFLQQRRVKRRLTQRLLYLKLFGKQIFHQAPSEAVARLRFVATPDSRVLGLPRASNGTAECFPLALRIMNPMLRNEKCSNAPF